MWQGDLGGPMIYQKPSGTNIQLGVASFWYEDLQHKQKCSSGYPSGFTRVSSYISWIQSTSSATTHIIQSFKSILLTTLVGVVTTLRST